MAVYRQVHISFWQDPDVLELTPEQKYFYLYLMTNSKTRQCGCYEISKRVVMLETGYNGETIDKLIDVFVEMGKVKYNPETREILLVNWFKHNNSQSNKVKRCVEKEVEQIKFKPFKKYCIDTLLIEYRYSMDTEPQKEKEEEKEKEKKEQRKNIPPMLAEVEAYCNERNNGIDAEQFIAFYQSKDWMIGKNKMKDWKSAIITWEKKKNLDNKEKQPEYRDLTNAYKE